MTVPLQIRTVVSMPFEENTYVLWLAGRTDAVVIDPGLEPELIFDCLRDEGLISDDVQRKVERELDLEQSKYELSS